jgi:uncharacterized protein
MEYKLTFFQEIAYVLGVIILALSVAIVTASNLGLSMIVLPAYVLSQKISWLTFGQAEYVIQGILLIIFCLVMRKFKVHYLWSFITCLLYGACLDLFRLIPIFNPNMTDFASLPLYLRIIFFIVGTILTGFSVALLMKSYFHPQVYDLFTKYVSRKFNIKYFYFKLGFDICFLALGIGMGYAFGLPLCGVGIGTLIATVANSILITFFSNLLDRIFKYTPRINRLSDKFQD